MQFSPVSSTIKAHRVTRRRLDRGRYLAVILGGSGKAAIGQTPEVYAGADGQGSTDAGGLPGALPASVWRSGPPLARVCDRRHASCPANRPAAWTAPASVTLYRAAPPAASRLAPPSPSALPFSMRQGLRTKRCRHSSPGDGNPSPCQQRDDNDPLGGADVFLD